MEYLSNIKEIDNLRKEFFKFLVINGIYKDRKWKSYSPLKRAIENTHIGEMDTFKEKVYALLHGVYEKPRCYCGKIPSLISTVRGFSKYCSKKCAANSQSTHTSREKTCLEKFGVKNAFQNTNVKEQIKKTNLLRYGVEFGRSSEISKEKYKQTCLEKYGVDNVAKSESTKNKIEQTNLIKYGTKNAASSPNIRKKIEDTNLVRYGAKSSMNNPHIRKKMKDAMVSKYGVEHNSQIPKVVEKMKESNLQTYKITFLLQRLKQLHEKNIQPVGWNIADYVGQNVSYQFKHDECGTIFDAYFSDGKIPICPKCNHARSLIEQKLANTLATFFPETKFNDRMIIKPKEIDILIKNIGIEVNGFFGIMMNAAEI